MATCRRCAGSIDTATGLAMDLVWIVAGFAVSRAS